MSFDDRENRKEREDFRAHMKVCFVVNMGILLGVCILALVLYGFNSEIARMIDRVSDMNGRLQQIENLIGKPAK